LVHYSTAFIYLKATIVVYFWKHEAIESEGVQMVWKGLKDCILDVAEQRDKRDIVKAGDVMMR